MAQSRLSLEELTKQALQVASVGVPKSPPFTRVLMLKTPTWFTVCEEM
jgi:hypothetical protein